MAKSLMHWLKSDVRLLKINEVDELYRSNPFILTGYRDKTSFLGMIQIFSIAIQYLFWIFAILHYLSKTQYCRIAILQKVTKPAF